MKSIILSLVFIISFSIWSNAQELTTNGERTVKTDSSAYNHSPKKAAIMSSALPGLGQIYNKKYWKVPIIYAGFGALTYYIIDNNKNYIEFRDAYRARVDNDPTNDNIKPEYTTDNLRIIKNIYWKNRDLMVILTAVLYAVNILDATVDAHFFTYDISDDLSFNISPIVEPSMSFGRTSTSAISFSLNF